MSNSTEAPAPATRRARTPRRGGPTGRLLVGDYVGHLAADAAQAVRRAGLRPGLDRSFGCDPNQTGHVVAQEPPAGDELERNGMVTLYVAAPGMAGVEEAAAAAETAQNLPAPPRAPHVTAAPTPSVTARARRPRKPGLATSTTHAFDPPPEPTMPAEHPASQDQPVASQATWTAGCDAVRAAQAPDGVLEQSALQEQGGEGLSREEFVADTQDVFAARGGEAPPWRRVYPRRSAGATLRRVLTRSAEHPLLLGAVGVMFAVWVAVALAAALPGHPPRSRPVNVLSQGNPGTRPQTAAAGLPRVIVGRPAGARTTRTGTRRPRAQEPPWAHRKRGPAASARRPHVKPAAPAPPSPPSSQTPPAGAREQKSGGPFSP